MFEINDPLQVTMFPELATSTSLPSITTQPEFDQALSNQIRICDLGAFVQLNISGIEKGYSLNINELGIPIDFFRLGDPFPVLNIHLFPQDVRRQLQNLVYGIKAYFNSDNSLSTAFGPFLYRHYFREWNTFLENEKELLQRTIKKMLGKRTYSRYFLDQFSQGYNLFKQAADITAPWKFSDHLTLSIIQEQRSELFSGNGALADLAPTDIHYPLKIMTVKTQHIPLKMVAYLKQIQIIAFFKTIHLEHLIDITIESVNDIKLLIEKM